MAAKDALCACLPGVLARRVRHKGDALHVQANYSNPIDKSEAVTSIASLSTRASVALPHHHAQTLRGGQPLRCAASSQAWKKIQPRQAVATER